MSKALSDSIDVCAKEAHRLLLMMAAQFMASVEGKWKQKNVGLLLGFKGEKAASDMQLYVGRQLLDYVPLQKTFGKDATRLD